MATQDYQLFAGGYAVDGVKMNVKVNGGTFSIDDETITTKIVVCISGELIKTDIFISETITRGESCEE